MPRSGHRPPPGRLLVAEGWTDVPSWELVVPGDRPPDRLEGIAEPGEWRHGWQHCASRTRNLFFRDHVLLPSLPPSHRALLRSLPSNWPPGKAGQKRAWCKVAREAVGPEGHVVPNNGSSTPLRQASIGWCTLLRCDPRLASHARWRAPPRRGRRMERFCAPPTDVSKPPTWMGRVVANMLEAVKMFNMFR